jgi:hypothetical protein
MTCVSGRTVARRWKDMGLKASLLTEASLPKGQVIQLVMDQMNLDPAGVLGQNALKHEIAMRTGYHLKR